MAESRVNKFVSSLSERQVRDAPIGTAASPGGQSNGSAVPPTQAPPVPEKRQIFDPQMLSKLGQLEIIANTVVDGFLSGKHRSTHKGGCTDFAEFRPYSEGDDIRQLDWRHYAKCDRYYVKQFDDETNLQALLVADASGSMQAGRWPGSPRHRCSVPHAWARKRRTRPCALPHP